MFLIVREEIKVTESQFNDSRVQNTSLPHSESRAASYHWGHHPLFSLGTQLGRNQALTCITCRLYVKEGPKPLLGWFIPHSCCLLVTLHSFDQIPLNTKAPLVTDSQVEPALGVLKEMTDKLKNKNA